jgi:hypothetical protein
MCTDEQEFTTVVGPRRSVAEFVELFPRSNVADRHRIEQAQLIDLAGLSDAFLDPASPTVAVIEHAMGQSFSIAAELQAQFLAGDPYDGIDPLPELLFEPGFDFRATAAVPGPVVALDQNGFRRLQATMPQIPAGDRAAGLRVAVLDTGARNVVNDMVDFTQRPPVPVPSIDDNGHGTAVSEIISTLAPSADIHPLRVLGAQATGPSYQVLAGLAYALWSAQFDIVNASLTSATSSMCEHSLGTSVSYIVRTCRAHKAGWLPLLVAAAGNDSRRPSGYPAVVPSALVALALEEDPPASGTFVPATYNSSPPHMAQQLEAFGGSSGDPIGNVTSGSTSTPLYGTSFAAAVVTASYLP